MIEQQDLADADKKKILQSKKWKEHAKEHPGAVLIPVEKEEEILQDKEAPKETPPHISSDQVLQPPPTETKVDTWWLRDEERKILEPPKPEMLQSHEAQHVAWECNCGKSMEPPKEKEAGQGYKIQKDEDEGPGNTYKTENAGNEMYGRNETPGEAPGGAYLGGGNMQDRQDNLYGRQP